MWKRRESLAMILNSTVEVIQMYVVDALPRGSTLASFFFLPVVLQGIDFVAYCKKKLGGGGRPR